MINKKFNRRLKMNNELHSYIRNVFQKRVYSNPELSFAKSRIFINIKKILSIKSLLRLAFLYYIIAIISSFSIIVYIYDSVKNELTCSRTK